MVTDKETVEFFFVQTWSDKNNQLRSHLCYHFLFQQHIQKKTTHESNNFFRTARRENKKDSFSNGSIGNLEFSLNEVRNRTSVDIWPIEFSIVLTLVLTPPLFQCSTICTYRGQRPIKAQCTLAEQQPLSRALDATFFLLSQMNPEVDQRKRKKKVLIIRIFC